MPDPLPNPDTSQTLSPDCAILAIDTSGNIVGWTASAQLFFGWENEEILGQPIFRILGNGSQDDFLQELNPQNQFQTVHSEIVELETESQNKNGDRIPVSIVIERLEFGGNRQALISVREHSRWIGQRAHFAAIIDSSYDAIIARDRYGRIISWNSGAQHVYGYTPEEVLGRTINIILPDGQDEEEAEIHDVLRNGKRFKQFEVKRQRKNGTLIDIAMSIAPIRDSRGRIVGSSTIERDITQRNQREKELRKAKHDAEKADRAKSEFLANISHELRTPMNAILGMLGLGLGEELSDVMRDYLSTAHESAQTLLHLLNDLLDFSRMTAGHLELDNEPFRLREAVDAAVKTHSLRASEKGLELACQIAKDVPKALRGDGMRLRQLIVNLTGNAIKFTDRGEILVKVGLQSRDVDRVVLQFSIRDTGVGISPEDQKKIFAPFTQVDASTTRKESGSGLGLAIVRELVEKMGGKIGLESELGRGSHFFFTVPFELLPDDRFDSDVTELVNLPVLVVDDNKTNRVILEEILANWSMQPIVASSAAEAIRLVEEAEKKGCPFQVAIVDGLMPDMDGFQLVEHLNGDETISPLTVLMLSSADRQTFKERCQESDVSAYLEKPVSQSELLDTLMTVMKGPLLDRESFDQLKPTCESMEILVAEDTPANQKVIRAILEKRGHHVHLANNGREAVEQIKQRAFDVILMDVQMPTMDGLQATRTIRELSDATAAETPILAMTAHARREDRQRCLAAGMDAYLSKPIDSERLIHLVESVRNRLSGMVSTDTWERARSQHADEGKASQINIQSALARMGGDRDLVRDLAEFFLQDVPQLLADLEEAIKSGQSDEAERAAHTIKGLAANFDAETLATQAIKMEDHSRNNRLRDVAKMLPEVKSTARSVSRELKDFLKS